MAKTLKFIPNISTMFKESSSLLLRFKEAKSAGFDCVELQFPYDFSLKEIVDAKNNAKIHVKLINAYPGVNGCGFAALPGQEKEFKSSLSKSIEYAKALDVHLIHILAGRISKDDVNARDTYLENFRYAGDLLKEAGIVGLIEGVNSRFTLPGYFVDSAKFAADLVREINHPNIRLQLDIFHLQITDGCLTENIKELLPLAAHVQVAQVPGRDEPTADGEINYAYVFDLLARLGYAGHVGLEYIPKTNTLDGLASFRAAFDSVSA